MRRTLFVLLLAPACALAQPPSPQQQRQAEAAAAIKDAVAHAVHGPANVALGGIAHIALPAHDLWFPGDYARRVLRSWGNAPGPNTLGLLAGQNAGHDWVATVSTTREGYVKDEDSKSLDAGKILQQLREEQDEANKERTARGFPGLDLRGWLQPPAYYTRTHRLIWALVVADAGVPSDDGTVNYNTRNLGRQGYISLNLLSSKADFAADKPVADRLLDGFSYDGGSRYEDFNAGTDHVAAYGLAALIGVVALKKLGFLALALGFGVKFAKIGALAVVGVGAALRRVFRRKPQPKTPV